MLFLRQVAPNDAQSAWFWIVPDQLGNIPIEVKAQSHLAADALRRMLLVKVCKKLGWRYDILKTLLNVMLVS